ncbi:type II secretion system protein [Roseateles koreensis]|uniref:Type II secretion system protein n=1 Tax=Roseateles koreensis TaxID=2987526 RepID=A0ABT5KV53_9BURK|nr:type II secretion system protein [Roseateles koreensis]MDC8785706.1 type II secretion system protein [Roseateles koreensis]
MPASAQQRGFTYLGLLFFVALLAAGMAALGQSWQLAAQREREQELVFRGEEIARAIASYAKAGSTSASQYPARFEDLLEDRRGPVPRHHLRRLYADPFTGQADWVLVKETGEVLASASVSGSSPEPGIGFSFSAVHSRSNRALLRSQPGHPTTSGRASDWVFDGKALLTPPVAAHP